MGIAKLYGQSGSGGKINGITEEYYVVPGEKVNKGDFIEFVVTEPTYVDFTSNPAPTTWSGSSDGLSATDTNNYGEWSVSATSVDSTSYPVQYAFDSDTSTNYRTKTMSQNARSSLSLVLPKGLTIKPSKITITSMYCTTSSGIYGTKADGTEVLLGTFGNGSTKQTTTITVSDEEYYSKFRISMQLSLTSGNARVYSFEITSGTLKIEPEETTVETQVRKTTTSEIYGVAKSSGGGGDMIKVYQPYPEKRLVMADGNILTTSNGDVFLLKEAI